MAKSKFQVKAKKSVKQKQQHKGGDHRPKYYDETLKKSAKKAGTPAVGLIVAAIVIVAGVVGMGIFLDQQSDDPESSIFNRNPTSDSDPEGYQTDITITDIDGNQYILRDHEGKVVVLYFHYLTCVACETSGPILKSVMASYSSSDLLVISITVQADSDTNLKNWAQSNGYTWPIVRDTQTLPNKFGVQYTPTTVFLGKDGAEEEKFVGVKSEADIKAVINGLL